MKTEEFKVGDRVIATITMEPITSGMTGTVVNFKGGWVGVRFDLLTGGHDFRQHVVGPKKFTNGWWFDPKYLYKPTATKKDSLYQLLVDSLS